MALADAIEGALGGWVERSVARISQASGAAAADLAGAADEAGRRAVAEMGPAIRDLLAADIDAQATTPLALLRQAAAYPTLVLRDAGIPIVERDDMQARLFPEDVYDLAPATFGDLGPEVGDAGIAWGAAKAYEHLRRHAPGPSVPVAEGAGPAEGVG